MNTTSEHWTPTSSWMPPASEDGALRADQAMVRGATPATKGDAPRFTDELARKYLVRVVAHAKRLARRLPAHVSLGDLISAGMLGVVEGFLRFDPSRAETLDAFLDHRIRGALLDELRRNDPLTRGQRTFARKLGRATRAAEGAASEESLAGALGLSLASFHERVAQVSIAQSVQATGDGLGVENVRDDGLGPDAALDARERRTLLAQSAETLSARERELLALHYEHGQNFREIGIRFGVSESRVSQLHTHAIQHLRARIAA
jgi:RNA polymerase sigma factor for flagellar operon FliA